MNMILVSSWDGTLHGRPDRAALDGGASEREHHQHSSIAAWLPSEGECAYQATKAGLQGLTRALAFESAPFGVRVNAIAPGLVDNPFLARLYSEEHVARLQSRIPMKRSADPAEIAGAAFWLASDDAAYVTGECLTVAGGWYMHA
jgi:NAD(P)-dependent dehydrogenase (short-subunit alcohol dehydrogenase family)